MTTAILAYSRGKLVGRCDARCHDSMSPNCTCICGGRLHATGSRALEVATEHLNLDLEEQARDWAVEHGLDPDKATAKLGREVEVPRLF